VWIRPSLSVRSKNSVFSQCNQHQSILPGRLLKIKESGFKLKYLGFFARKGASKLWAFGFVVRELASTLSKYIFLSVISWFQWHEPFYDHISFESQHELFKYHIRRNNHLPDLNSDANHHSPWTGILSNKSVIFLSGLIPKPRRDSTTKSSIGQLMMKNAHPLPRTEFSFAGFAF